MQQNKFKILVLFIFVTIFTIKPGLIAQETDTTTHIPQVCAINLIEFSDKLNDIFNDPNFSNAHWGVVIQSMNTGEYLYKRNEIKNFMPASNMKIFTTATGLLKLGTDFKYETSLNVRGKIDDDRIVGDVILKSNGDPTITGRFYNDDPLFVYSKWADSLLEMGIEEITGNVLADDDDFDDVGLGVGWSWDDESFYYSAPVSAVCLNDNCIDISLTPGSKIGSKALIVFRPNTRYVNIFNDVITVGNDSLTKIQFVRDRGTNQIYCSGTIRISEPKYTESISINNPTQFAAVVLKEVFESKGIKVRGYAVDLDEQKEFVDYSTVEKLFVQYSPNLSEIVKVINKRSNNLYAEQLLKTIGYKEFKYGTSENGIKACSTLYSRMGINPNTLSIFDGSGLSRMNMITPIDLSRLLFYMNKSKVFNSFYNSLPIAGVDGTIASRMKGTNAQNNVRAKTGYIYSARALSGYVTTADGELLSFVMIANNFTVPVPLAENIQDLICNLLSNLTRGKKIDGK